MPNFTDDDLATLPNKLSADPYLMANTAKIAFHLIADLREARAEVERLRALNDKLTLMLEDCDSYNDEREGGK